MSMTVLQMAFVIPLLFEAFTPNDRHRAHFLKVFINFSYFKRLKCCLHRYNIVHEMFSIAHRKCA